MYARIQKIVWLLLLLIMGSRAVAQKADSLVTVTGTLTDALTRKPLAGVNVAWQDQVVTLTDDKGGFTLRVPDYNVTLIVSGAGYQYKELPLKGHSQVNAVLYEEGFASLYDEASFPAGNKPLNRSTQAVALANVQGGWQLNNETADSYLQGRIAGLQATRRSGTPGIGADLLVRGFTSLYATNQPLIVVDGVIYDNASYGNSFIGGHSHNPLQNINVKDIDNITLVKDAVTTYGSKAANGVLFITTAHAKSLATHMDFAAYSGINFQPAALPVMQAGDYRVYLSDLLKTAGYSDAQIQALPYMKDDASSADYFRYHNNTDWQKKVLQKGVQQNYYLKVTGGDDIARYALSLGYAKTQPVTRNTSLTAYQARFNADLNLTRKLMATTSLAFSYNEQRLQAQGLSAKTNPLYLALVKAPFLSVQEINDKGQQSPNLAETDVFNVSNPVALIDNAKQTDKNYRFLGLINAEYTFDSHFKLASTTSITYDKVRENLFIPRKGVANDTLSNAVADSRLGSRVVRLFSLYNDTRVQYTTRIANRHKITAAVGFRYQQSTVEEDYIQGYNSATDDMVSIGTGVNALRSTGGDIGKWRWLNNYATVDYGFNDKYFVTASLAGDISSRFGRDIPGALSVGGNKVALFPAAGVSWLLSSENWLAPLHWIELLKLRVSAGAVGNDDIGNYTSRKYYVSQNLLGMQGLVRGNIPNPALQWEKVTKLNAGIDAALLQERVQLSVDVYRNTTSHLLTYEPAAAVSGVDFTVSNHAQMQTTGFEAAVNVRALNGPLVWDIGATVGKYNNRVTRLAGAAIINNYAGAGYITREGSAANLFYGYKTRGVYTTNAAAAQDGYAVTNAKGVVTPFTGGDVRFTDNDNNKQINDNDREVIGNPNPDWFGSFFTSLKWKRFTLDAQFTYSIGNDVYNYNRSVLEAGSGTNNQTLRVAGRWRGNGHITDVPKATWGDPVGNSRFSDRWIEDGSYIRLRTVSLTYDIPVGVKWLQYARVYVTGNNLFTFTHYLGYDPEFSANNSVFSKGVDTGLEPIYKSLQLGVRVGL
ncbi:TonB-linked outer membrane protein, SusC/RagA family [Filimonas lacunae]|uniref:TonB-linked outer membrane protein, SusC/RagA family n=1 Tax=Filimonas lacunae TaxID=477680 RepID=A0A173MD32_9BACT|nr:SusC/RagA family TonB-linked outer membrane protein [Filimonas lacunae]BAV05430.1 TonB-dependent receptor [Filimonas lacunae]SIT21195.1 TonB-linked outer membrane protein, SusC/RagA family [Filimonas lacunae]